MVAHTYALVVTPHLVVGVESGLSCERSDGSGSRGAYADPVGSWVPQFERSAIRCHANHKLPAGTTSSYPVSGGPRLLKHACIHMLDGDKAFVRLFIIFRWTIYTHIKQRMYKFENVNAVIIIMYAKCIRRYL